MSATWKSKSHAHLKKITIVAALVLATFGSFAFIAPASAHAEQPAPRVTSNVWNELAFCESSGRWHVNTGNGYYGGLQFSASTWRAFGGTRYAGMAHRATKTQQIVVARRVQAQQGWGAWPACSSRLGLR